MGLANGSILGSLRCHWEVELMRLGVRARELAFAATRSREGGGLFRARRGQVVSSAGADTST
eukprot:scaffold3281_cov286-Prasinococcus_capsulatus_cf.AAC.14